MEDWHTPKNCQTMHLLFIFSKSKYNQLFFCPTRQMGGTGFNLLRPFSFSVASYGFVCIAIS